MIAAEGRPYGEADFDKLEPIHGGTTINELIDRFRDQFGLDKFNDFVKVKTAETLGWLPATGMPTGTVEDPANAKLTRSIVLAPAGVRVALALLLRDVILPAMATKVNDEPTSKPARKQKETV
jgi:hypothetical protein